jgi:hypothetical protein
MPLSPWRRWLLSAVLGLMPVPLPATAAEPSDAYAKHLTALHEHLCTVNVLEAVKAAQEARKLRPDACEPRQALTAIHDALGPATGAQRIPVDPATCPAEPEDSVSPEGPPPEPGQERFVTASRLRARRAPDPSAPVIADLRINDKVKVLALEGDWARIALVRAAPREGFILARFLGVEPLDKDRLLADAKRLGTEGKAREALRHLQRAAALAPEDFALQRQLVCDAARLGRYPIALATVAALPPRFELLPRVELSFTVPLATRGRELAKGLVQGTPDTLECGFKQAQYKNRAGDVTQRQECRAEWKREQEEILVDIVSTVVRVDFCDDMTGRGGPPSPCSEDREEVTTRCRVQASSLLTARGGRGLKAPLHCEP